MIREAVDRLKRGNLDWTLAALQVLALLAVAVLGICLLLLYRHQTEDYFIDAWAYLASIRIAVPPLLVLIASYAYAVLTGKSVTEAPRAYLSWLRNRFLQRRDWLLAFSIGAAGTCVAILVFTTCTAPPHYVTFVARLLGGESDDHEVVRAEIKRMQERDRIHAERMELVARVFVERRTWNFENRPATTTMPRFFLRALTTNIDDTEWESHPLRMHAAAESESMYAQALFATDGTVGADPSLWHQRRDEALALYRRVSESSDPRATPLLRRSAENNLANLHFYLGESEQAVAIYRTIVGQAPNTTSYGNWVASLIVLGQPAEAVEVGEAGKAWAFETQKMLAEPVQFANLLANLGFAYWMLNEPRKALVEMQSANDLNPDTGSKQNLALARWLAGDRAGALAVARTLPEVAVTPNSQAAVASTDGDGGCTYLIRGLLAADLRTPEGTVEAVANLFAFLGEPRQADDLSAAVDTQLPELMLRAYRHLQGLKAPCASLSLVPGIKRAMTPG
ncbi:MAG: hypothetical protein ACRDUX_15185 [Mycobacterium sp.]